MTDGWTTCQGCGGSGEFVDCIDDLCHGQDRCLHGDPPGICQTCQGEGGWASEHDDEVVYAD